MSSNSSLASRSSATPERARIRLAVLDDHEVLLDSLSSWIAANAPDFDLVLVARSWLGLVRSDHFPVDLVLLDFQISESVSIEARVRTCRAAGAAVIVLSALDTREARERSVAAGAAEFLTKSIPLRDVMDTARRVMGVRVSTPEKQPDPQFPADDVPLFPPDLSPGEVEALKGYAAGLSTRQVADRMNVKYETVKTYLRRVREKYAKANRPAGKKADLIRRAAEDGYLE